MSRSRAQIYRELATLRREEAELYDELAAHEDVSVAALAPGKPRRQRGPIILPPSAAVSDLDRAAARRKIRAAGLAPR